MRYIFDPPSEPPDGDPVCRICDHTMELTLVGWECVHDHDACLGRQALEQESVATAPRRRTLGAD